MWKNFLLFCVVAIWGTAGTVHAQSNLIRDNINNFTNRTGARVTLNKATGTPGFISIPPERSIPTEGASAAARSADFLKANAGIYGLRAGQDEMVAQATTRDQFGLQHVTMRQHFKGIPIYDGVLKFHYDARLTLRSVNGNFIPDIRIETDPSITAEDASNRARREITKQKGVSWDELKAINKNLYIFKKGLAQGYQGANYLVYEIEVTNEKNIREFLFIDAHNGSLVEQFTGIHGLTRKLYNRTYNPASPSTNLLWSEGDPFPGTLNNNIWQQSSVMVAGQTYHFFKNAFGYNSYNGAEATMISTHNNPDIDCPNANWNGVSANYCDATASDDVVAHEWAHAYTEYTSGLIYGWQPGALNESMSDIWGETIDLINGYMDEDESSQTLRQPGCGSSTRWLLSEKATAFGSALRDMWNPNCKGNPGRVLDPMFHCWTSDGGGVHANSGVTNHAYALLVDGGNYNNYQINGIGLTKSAHIIWRIQTHYLSATSNFATFGNAMIAAANDLIGAPLPALSTLENDESTSQDVITAADVAEVQKVVNATELLLENNCGFTPMFTSVNPLCDGAKPANAIFFENFENGLGSWAVSNTPGTPATWTDRNWQIKENIYGRSGKVAFGPDPGYGDCSASTYQHGLLLLESPQIPIPAAASGPFMLSFSHLVAMQDLWSGGRLTYQIDNGAWLQIPDAAFVSNGYNRLVNSGGLNPLQGKRVFSAGNDGDVKSDWGTSVVNLSALGMSAGQAIRIRWELGTSYCTGIEGWYLDDISVYTCASTPAVHFAESSSVANEGAPSSGAANCLEYSEKTVRVMIDQTATSPVTLSISVDPASTAKVGATNDFTFSPAVITLDAANPAQDIVVRINNDAYPEGPETIKFVYTLNNNGGSAYAGSTNQVHELVINDDDLQPGNRQNTLLSSNFDRGPEGWSIKNGGSDNSSWVQTSVTAGNAPVQLNVNGRPLFFCFGYANTVQSFDEIIESPSFSVLSQKNLKLSFRHYFLVYPNAFNEQGLVEVWDGTSWHTIKTFCASGCAVPGTQGGWDSAPITMDIPDQYVNSQMKIRFRYIARDDYYWAIDDVTVTSSNSTSILTNTNSGNGDTQYLGPNETAVFYDPATGAVMAKIKNLSAHDYGCTTVEIDRSGTDATAWFGTYKISNKTFKVTPAIPNSSGKYEITLYYKTEELPSFNGSAVKSMGKSSGGIGGGNQGSTSWAEVQTAAVFDADYAFTSTFDSGFSGFGLSDAPPVGSLPVYLANLTGIATNEGNLLNWSTSSEAASSHFSIEYSANGRSFEEIGKVSSKGNSVKTEQYSYLDPSHRNGLAFYRLRMVDLDGTSELSPIISISSGRNHTMKFGPNPVREEFSIALPSNQSRPVSFTVVNVSGQKVIERKAVTPENGKFKFNVENLATGFYQVIVDDGKTKVVIPIVKQ